MKVSVIGCGYVGLVTGACLAEIGHEVTCADSDATKISLLNSGKLPIYEPGLDGVVAKTCEAGRLKFFPDAAQAIAAGDTIFICVGTPPLPSGDADLSAIDRVARVIATEARGRKLIVEKSTVPAQTGQQLKKALTLYGRGSDAQFSVASNPEFLREGTGIADFLHPDRIVVGVEEKSAGTQLREIYEPVLAQRFNCPVHAAGCPPAAKPEWFVTTINSAELIKHVSNSFLALKISYANMVADLAEKLGADIEEVMRAVGMDPRIGPAFFRAGLGFGGFCLPKDLQAFVRLAERAGVDFTLLKEAERINQKRDERFLEKIHRALWVVREKQIGVLGLAFKPNTDDIRFAPSIALIEKLRGEGACLRAYDPKAMEKVRAVFPDIAFCDSAYEAAHGAEALLIVTEWQEFKTLDWERIRETMARPLVLDGRNLLTPVKMRELGFEYHSLGRAD